MMLAGEGEKKEEAKEVAAVASDQQVFDWLEEGKLYSTGMNIVTVDTRRARLCFGMAKRARSDDCRPWYYIESMDSDIWHWDPASRHAHFRASNITHYVVAPLFEQLRNKLALWLGDIAASLTSCERFYATLFNMQQPQQSRPQREEALQLQMYQVQDFEDTVDKVLLSIAERAREVTTTITTTPKHEVVVLAIKETCDLLGVWAGLHRASHRFQHSGRLIVRPRPAVTKAFDAILDTLRAFQSTQSYSMNVIAVGIMERVHSESKKGNRALWRRALPYPPIAYESGIDVEKRRQQGAPRQEVMPDSMTLHLSRDQDEAMILAAMFRDTRKAAAATADDDDDERTEFMMVCEALGGAVNRALAHRDFPEGHCLRLIDRLLQEPDIPLYNNNNAPVRPSHLPSPPHPISVITMIISSHVSGFANNTIWLQYLAQNLYR